VTGIRVLYRDKSECGYRVRGRVGVVLVKVCSVVVYLLPVPGSGRWRKWVFMMRVYDRMLGLPRQLGILSVAASINELSTRQNMCQVPQFEKRVQTVGWQSRRINVDIAMREVIQEVREGCALVREKAILQVRGSRRVD